MNPSEESTNERGPSLRADDELRQMLDAAPFAAFSFDAEGTIVDWNPAAALLFGRSQSRACGKPWKDLVKEPANQQRIEQELAALSRSRARHPGPKRFELTGSFSKARTMATEWTITKTSRNGEKAFQVFVRELGPSPPRHTDIRYDSCGLSFLSDRPAHRGHLIEDAIKICVGILGEVIGWPVTHAFIRSRDGRTLVSSGIWQFTTDGDFQQLRDATETAVIPPGADLPGRIWKSGEAAWITDVASDGNILRSADMSRAGIRSAFGIPVKVDNEVVTIIEFFHTIAAGPNVRLMNLARAVGDQLEYVIQGMRWHEERSRLAAIVDSTGDAVIGKDLEGTITSWNKGAEASYGWTAEEAVGKPISMLFPRGIAVESKPTRDAVLNQIPLSNFETTRLHRDGRILDVAVTVAPIFDRFGEVVGSSTIERDITKLKSAQHQLEEREAQFRQLLDSSASAIFGVDEDGRCTFCNPMCASRLGYNTPEDLVGAEMFRLVRNSNGDSAAEENTFVQSLRKGLVTHVEREVFQSDSGRSFPVEYWTFPLMRFGELTGAVVTFIDISERLESEAERAQLAAIVDSSGDAIISRDRDGVINSWNTGAELVYGWSAREAIGQSVSLVLPPGMAREESEILESIKTGRRLEQFETKRLRRDGTIIDVSVTFSPIWNSRGQMVGFSSIERDITSRLRRVRELREARDAAEEANRVQGEFLANVSHELRTPMNAVLGMLDLALQEDISTGLRDYLQTAKDSADSLLLLVNDILDVSRLDAGRFELDSVEFDIREMLDDAIKLLSLRAYEKGLELACRIDRSVPASAIGDPIRLRQILMNLMGNAIKFTDRGEVVIDVTVSRVFPGAPVGEEFSDSESNPGGRFMLQFCISDTGIGIASEDQERIFSPFTQADSSSTRRFSGTGLGLAICHQLVSLMGGEIWLESAPGRGSRFYFTTVLQQDDEDVDSLARESAAVAELKDLPVLIVDDNLTNRRILVEHLQNWSMRPTAAASAKQGIRKLQEAAAREKPYSLVIVDAMMPETDGFTLIDEARASGSLECATILMHSPADRHVFYDRFQQADVAITIEKPVSQSDLLDAIMTALRGPQFERNSVARITATSRSLRVLITEDTPANQKVIKTILEKRGHQTTIANNGREAIELLKGQVFDIILMDLQMPIMDGLQATTAIRKLSTPSARLPIIAMTAHAMQGDKERCFAAGMDGYIAKPINSQDLIRLVERHAAEFGSTWSIDADGDSDPRPPIAAPPDRVLNMNAALHRVDHDFELLSDMVGYFLSDSPDLMKLVQSSIEERNAAELTRAAHSLKGLCANFDADSAKEAAASLETIGRTGDLSNASIDIAALEAEIGKLSSELRNWKEQAKPKPPQALDLPETGPPT